MTGWRRGVVVCVVSSWTFFWLVGGEVIWESTSSTFWFQPVWGLQCFFWGQLTPSTWRRFQDLQNSSKDMAQNIIYSPWGGTKGPWLCGMAKVLLFCLAWLFSFFSAFLTSLIKFILWLIFLYKQKAGGGHGWGSILGRPHRVLLGHRSAGHTLFLIKASGLKSLKTTEAHTSVSVCEVAWADGTRVLFSFVALWLCVSLPRGKRQRQGLGGSC